MKRKLIIILLLSFFIIGGTYAQKKKKAKKITLKGLVVDAENNPIQNASIFIDGINCNAKSDDGGFFQLKVKPTIKSITVFSIFNGAAEIAYQGQEEITFVLSTENNVNQDPLNKPQKIEQDLVNVGYGNTSKQNITSSVGKIDESKLRNTRHYTNIYEMLVGELPGVVVNGTSITIRGPSTSSTSNEPLLVVNGSPISSIFNISPNDVKEVSVLKGASAAIYGGRGMNGVILITLKTGKDE